VEIRNATDSTVDEEKEDEKLMFLQYRGNVSKEYEKSLRKCNAPVKMVFTLKKLKTILRLLKPPVEKMF